MIRPRVREEDLELVLNHVQGEAVTEANDAWCHKDGPDASLLPILWACRRIQKSLKRSSAGRRAYETAKARGNLPPILTRVQGVSLVGGKVVEGDDGRPIYVFMRRV